MREIHPNRAELEKVHHGKIFTRDAKTKFHYENIGLFDQGLVFLLRAFRLEKRGLKNAADLQLKKIELELQGLPAAFADTRILFIADMHIPNVKNQHEKIMQIADSVGYDYCLLGGDYTFKALSKDFSVPLEQIISHLVKKSPVYGILGNHDSYRAAQFLSDSGVQMLINEHTILEKDGDKIYLAGVDDCIYFAADELNQAQDGIADGAFKILLSHAPGLYKEASAAGVSLYLAGHTHGGQICLPGQIPIIARDHIPRSFICGLWQYGDMTGYTSTGAGAGGIAARFFCPPEVVLFTLRQKP